jgi:cAMP phosphodiesterase
MRAHLLNGLLWPDFTQLPSPEDAVLKLHSIEPGECFDVNGYKVCAYAVEHTVPAVGYVIENAMGRRLLYTGDTGPTQAIWEPTGAPIHCAIIEVSLPNEMQEMALKTGHLTTMLLKDEIAKMHHVPDRIYITHPKPQFIEVIKQEILALGMDNISMLSSGDIIEV